jgi:three-Cys-motif partner protein
MKFKWPERHYIDLFAGAGFARIKDSDELVMSSAVLAANSVDPFTSIRVCEADSLRHSALVARLRPAEQASQVIAVRGDANACITELIAGIPSSGSLSVAFADPYGLHLDFETVEALASVRADLIVLLADNMDALRNWATYYLDNAGSNLDRFMGEPGWRELLSQTPSDKQAEALRKRYEERLRTLGYAHFGHERVMNDKGHDIYSLVYASRNAKGLEFWEKARAVDEGGQRSLFSP